MNDMSELLTKTCDAVNDTGLQCQKENYFASTGEYWEHAGGHIFATSETMNVLNTDHVDNAALLMGLPAGHHSPDECDGSYDYCSWRFINGKRWEKE